MRGESKAIGRGVQNRGYMIKMIGVNIRKQTHDRHNACMHKEIMKKIIIIIEGLVSDRRDSAEDKKTWRTVKISLQ